MNAVIVHVPTQRQLYLNDLAARSELKGFKAGALAGNAVRVASTNAVYASRIGVAASAGASKGFCKGFWQSLKGE